MTHENHVETTTMAFPKPKAKQSGKGSGATPAQRADTFSALATGTLQKRRWQSLDEVCYEGYCNGIRHCVETLLDFSNSRKHIAGMFECQSIPFPATGDPSWKGLWAFENWDDWVAVEESKSEDETPPENDMEKMQILIQSVDCKNDQA